MERAIPNHVGIIMDGNGRWAEMRGLPRSEGHKRGVERASEIVRAAGGIGIKNLSMYAFSLENWKRPASEISVIMTLLETFLINDLDNFMKENVRFKVIGNREKLSSHIRNLIEHVEKTTAENSRMVVYCALSYGGRDEIIRAVRKLFISSKDVDEITEKALGSLMDTEDAPDPDLIIRTSGEQRLSNFLLWQSAYSEFFFTSTLWPDFSREEFLEAIYQYQMRDRRFGKVKGGNIQCI
ncbi:MAG TPA: polyprenyl diphosphate synthase [Dissulfurispiraceae bacterium]|nr:polyprenyl diphosphate synthase [Dissulfurispiraceae bacterium]